MLTQILLPAHLAIKNGKDMNSCKYKKKIWQNKKEKKINKYKEYIFCGISGGKKEMLINAIFTIII
jgi:hypothetical protein